MAIGIYIISAAMSAYGLITVYITSFSNIELDLKQLAFYSISGGVCLLTGIYIILDKLGALNGY